MAYGNYCKRMAPGKAIIKIARKLVNRIYFVMKRNQPYVKCVVAEEYILSGEQTFQGKNTAISLRL